MNCPTGRVTKPYDLTPMPDADGMFEVSVERHLIGHIQQTHYQGWVARGLWYASKDLAAQAIYDNAVVTATLDAKRQIERFMPDRVQRQRWYQQMADALDEPKVDSVAVEFDWLVEP